jgi:hypothetical protein
MICCSFIFQPGQYDDEFRRLDAEIDQFARHLPGFEKVETWHSADGTTVNATYFFTDKNAVAQLARFPTHRQAKAQVNRWYKNFRVVVSEVTATYGSRELTT